MEKKKRDNFEHSENKKGPEKRNLNLSFSISSYISCSRITLSMQWMKPTKELLSTQDKKNMKDLKVIILDVQDL